MNYWCSCLLSTIFQLYWSGGSTEETHYHATSHWQILSNYVVSNRPHHWRKSTAQLWWWKTLIDCIVKCKYYYNAFATRRRPMQTRLSVIQLQSRIIATNTKVLFINYNLCTSLKLDSLSCSFIFIFFLSFFLPKDTKMYKEQWAISSGIVHNVRWECNTRRNVFLSLFTQTTKRIIKFHLKFN